MTALADGAARLGRDACAVRATGSRSRSGPSWPSCSSWRARVMRTADRCPGRWRASSSAASSAWRSKGCPTICLRCVRCSTAASRRPVEMARRLGALCAEPAHREAVQETVEQAFSLEQLVMRGDVDAGYLQAIGVSSPDAVVSELEDNLRALLRDMVCGHLALDLTGIADELLRTRLPAAGRSRSRRRRTGACAAARARVRGAPRRRDGRSRTSRSPTPRSRTPTTTTAVEAVAVEDGGGDHDDAWDLGRRRRGLLRAPSNYTPGAAPASRAAPRSTRTGTG